MTEEKRVLINRDNHPVSGFIHLFGAALAIAGTVLMIVKATHPPRPYNIVTLSIFGAAMILMLTASGLYHILPFGTKGLSRLRKIDHIMIFVLIAATYTPICLAPIRGGWGWSLFGVVWGITVAGIFFKIFWMKAPKWLSTAIYVFMGWLIVIGICPMIRNLQPGALLFLVLGGLFYSVGAIVYSLKKPNPWPGIFGFHDIWHIFVLLGVASHFVLMYVYVVKFD
jgi:hemolysin III